MTDQVPEQTTEAAGASGPGRQRRLGPAIRALLRTRIVAGLLVLIPIWVTWVVVKFVFDTMKSATEPIAWKVARMLQGAQVTTHIDSGVENTLISRAVTRFLAESSQGAVDPAQQQQVIDQIARKLTFALREVPDAPVGYASDAYLPWVVPVLAVLLTLCLLYFLGLLTASVFGRRLILMIERLFARLPLVKTIYKSVKQVVMTLGGSGPMKYQRVVLVEFPRPGMKCIGFLTAVMKDSDTGREMASVFIATTPNPTTGYMQIVPLKEVSETNWTVEEAVKVVMSGGVLSPPTVAFDRVHPVEWRPPTPEERAADSAAAESAETNSG